jgi:hypothetical protein
VRLTARAAEKPGSRSPLPRTTPLLLMAPETYDQMQAQFPYPSHSQ